MGTRELSADEHTESELDLGDADSAVPGSDSASRLPFGVSSRGVKGAAAVVGFVTIVVCAVIGGTMAVDSVARFDENRGDGATVLDDQQLDALPPGPGDEVTDIDDTERANRTHAASPRPSASPAVRKTTEKPGRQGTSGDDADTPGKQVDQVVDPKVQQAVTPIAEMGVIRNLSTGFCVDLPDAGVPEPGHAVSQYDCIPGAADNQDFQMVEQFGQYLIRNLKTNYCLDLPGSGSVDLATGVLASPCQAGDSDNQMFSAVPKGQGYWLVHVKSGLCLDVSNTNGGNKHAGQALTLFTCSTTDDHIWTVS